MKATQEARWKWITAYLSTHPGADALTTDFHEGYYQAFPAYKRRETFWGSQPVAQAMRDLAAMWEAGLVERGRIGIPNWQPGFPKHTLTYWVEKPQT